MRSNIQSIAGSLLATSLTVVALLSPLKLFAQPEVKSPGIQRSNLNKMSLNPATEILTKLADSKGTQSNSKLQQGKLSEAVKQLLMGTKDGGGGDDIALEFQSSAQKALLVLQQVVPETYKDLANQNIAATVEHAKVIVVDDVLDVEIKKLVQNSVAFNVPEIQTILVNRQRWKSMPNDDLKMTIALHEVLSLKGLEHTGYYPISTKIWNDLNRKRTVQHKDVGTVESAVYRCATSPANMIGLGVEYQISLKQDLSQVIYSQFYVGNADGSIVRAEMGRTRRNYPALIKNQDSQYYIHSRYYNSEDATFRDEDMILDVHNLVLNLLYINGQSLSIDCKLVSK